MTTYCIVRHHFDESIGKKVVKTGLSLEEAQEHCRDPETSSTRCSSPESVAYTEKHGIWFDGYDEE